MLCASVHLFTAYLIWTKRTEALFFLESVPILSGHIFCSFEISWLLNNSLSLINWDNWLLHSSCLKSCVTDQVTPSLSQSQVFLHKWGWLVWVSSEDFFYLRKTWVLSQEATWNYTMGPISWVWRPSFFLCLQGYSVTTSFSSLAPGLCVCVWMSWRPVLSLGIYILQIYRILHKSQVFCLMDFHRLNTLINLLIRWRNNIITSSVSGDTRFHLPPPKEMCSLTSEGMASFILLLCLIHTESNRIYFILWLALFSIMFVRSVYIFAHSCTYFHSWIVLYNMAISVYLFYSLNLGCFLMLAVRNSVAVNLLIWLLVNVCSYFFWVHT